MGKKGCFLYIFHMAFEDRLYFLCVGLIVSVSEDVLVKQANSVNLYSRQSGSGLFKAFLKFHKILFTDYLVTAN